MDAGLGNIYFLVLFFYITVFSILEAGGVYKLDIAPSSSIIKLLQTLSYSGDLALSASSTHLLTQIAVSVSRYSLSIHLFIYPLFIYPIMEI